LSHFPWALAILAVALQVLAGLVRAYRWRIFFVEKVVSTWRLFLVQHMGLGVNNVFPIRVMAEPVQLGLLTVRGGLSSGSVTATIVVDRTIDGMVTAGIVWLGVLFLPPLHAVRVPISALFLAFVAILVLAMAAPQIISRIPGLARMPFFANYSSAISGLWMRKGRLVLAIFLSIALWCCVAGAAWLVAAGLNLQVSFLAVLFVVVGVIIFTSYVPSLPAAAGTFEFAAGYLIGLFGVGKVEALTFAILTHLVLFVPPIIIAAIQLPREGMSILELLFLARGTKAETVGSPRA